MRFATLEGWLTWQESLNPKTIDLGLERTRQVWQRLVPPDLSSSTVISIAGTNGKGSTVALFEAIFKQAGYRTGSYTSPHLLRYNERIRLDGEPVEDQQIIDAFQATDEARKDVPLTYFEFGTLAALLVFAREKPEVVLLEVGLGGRLDAVNIIDADVSVVTSIGLDHQEWLGHDRETIGREKAGIFRPGRPAVFSGSDMPASIADQARMLQTHLYINGREFHCEAGAETWNWCGPSRMLNALPYPHLPGQHQLDNASGVIMALELLARKTPLDDRAVVQGLEAVRLTGRQQTVEHQGVQWVLDVAHNPHAVSALARQLKENPVAGRALAVLGMLDDKDVTSVLTLMQPHIDRWYFATIENARGMSAEKLAGMAQSLLPVPPFDTHDTLDRALKTVAEEAGVGDRVVVFGSFFTVAAALAYLDSPA
ncbi:bifunctional tetrahydrofolate synthase/dihydrofolate synthase [Thiolapillus sp.]|uniref:bifunctional tetrahydrofolate synthase/dihydrofolate synthase n=1 Tax=Thiolapillus sp. TaxID=2017437 RepID=UPI003AF48AB1